MRATFNSRCGFFAVVVIAVAAFVADTGLATAAEPKGYQVLAVGVSEYKSINSADGSDHDAKRVGDVLKNRKLTDKLQILTNKNATAAAIRAALREVEASVKPGEAVVLFFAGHGQRVNKGKDWLFLPHDFDERKPMEKVIWDLELMLVATALTTRGHDVLLAVDACHSGALITLAGEMGLVGAKRAKPDGRGALVIATSCRPNQLSSATRAEAGKYAGWFTTAFAETLGGKADANRDGVVAVSELRAHLEARLYVTTHSQAREPGLAWPAQDSLVAASPEAGEGFGVVRGDKKEGLKPDVVAADGFVPGGPTLPFMKPKAAPIGTWTITKCEVTTIKADFTPKTEQKKLRGDYTLTIRGDGTYTAKIKLPGSDTDVTEGKHGFSPGGEFFLKFCGGEDQFQFFNNEKDRITVRVQNSGSRWGSDTFYELKRVKP